MDWSMDTGPSPPFYSQQNRSGSDVESAEHAPLTSAQMLLIAADAAMQAPAVARGPSVTAPGRDSERTQCQAYGCPIDLRTTKPYCVKKRLCPDHLVAHALRRRGTSKAMWRFCQQCGKLEPIESFDGTKRSCRARLQKRRAHNNPRSTENPWKKQNGHGTYKKLQQKQKQDWGASASAVAGEDGYSDVEHDEQQDMMQACGSDLFDAAVAAAAAGRRDHEGHGEEYADHGALEHMRPPAAAAVPKHLYAGRSARNNLQQHQDLYESLLYSAAVAAAAAVAGGTGATGQPGTQHKEAATDDAASAGATAASVPSTLEDALLLLKKQAADAGGNAATTAMQADTARDHAFGLVGGESWRSSCDAESPHEQQHQQQHQQQLGTSHDAPSPESIAATLTAMAAGHRDHHHQQHRQQEEEVKQVFGQQQERQPYIVPQHQDSRSQQQHQQVTWHSNPLQYALPPPPAAAPLAHAHKPSLVGNTLNQSAHRDVHHSAFGQVTCQQQGVADDACHHRQQQLQPEETAAAPAAAPDMMDVDGAVCDHSSAAWGRIPGATAAGPSRGHNTPAKQDTRLQTLIDRVVRETNTQADAAATLAAMRVRPAPEPSSPIRAAMSRKQRYQIAAAQQQLEHSGVHRLAADVAGELVTAGSSPTQSGSSTHADPAATAAVAAAADDADDASRRAVLLATPDRVPPSGPQVALQTRASATAAAQPSAVLPTTAAVTTSVDLVQFAVPPTSAAAAGVADTDLGSDLGSGNGVGGVQGLGFLLTAGIGSLLAQDGQDSAAGVQLLTSILAQAPGAAATLLLAQQQQLQQLQAQQQQLMEQVEQQRQQHEALIEQVGKQQVAAATAGADHLPESDSALISLTDAESALTSSKVVAELADLVRIELHGVTQHFAESLAPLQAQVDKLQSELYRVSSVVQVGEIRRELKQTRGVISSPAGL